LTSSAYRAWLYLAATAAVFMLAAPGMAGAHAPKPKPIPARSAFLLPSNKHCLATRTLTIRLLRVRRVHWTRATIKLNGSHSKTVQHAGVKRTIKLRHLPRGTIHLTVTAKARDGRRATARRTYTTCLATPGPSPSPSPSPAPAPSPEPSPSPAAAAPGSYSGLAAGRLVTFYVSGDGAHIQDVDAATPIFCVGSGGQTGDHIGIDDIAIAHDGSFSATTTQLHGVLFLAPATYTYTFSGRFVNGSPSGTLREDVTYDDGTVHSCTSNDESWSADRDQQGDQSVAPPPAGSYTGLAAGRAVNFYVSVDGRQLQDFVATTPMSCVGSFSNADQILLDQVAIAPDGSFSVTGSQEGLLGDAPATYLYTLTGHVHGKTLAGVSRIAGRLREDITYDDGTVHTCSSDAQEFSATRDQQGPQTAGPPPAGSYTGLAAGRAVSFGVVGTHLTNVTAATALTCAGSSGQFGDQLVITDIAVGPDGSFSATAHRTGVLSGHPATFDYAFRGHTHGTTLAGVPRLAGTLREDISYDDGTVHDCTTNDWAWSAQKQ
jgi:hypothetical protein